MEQMWLLSRLAVTVTCLVCLGFSVGMCSESEPLIKTVVSSSLLSNGDLLYPAKLDKVQNITGSEWDTLVLRSNLPVLVLFTADDCERCRKMESLLDDLDVEYTGRFLFYKMDFKKAPVISKDGVEEIHVTQAPTTFIFRYGYPVDGFIGSDLGRIIVAVRRYAAKY